MCMNKNINKSATSTDIITDIKHYIDANFCEPLSVDSLAKRYSVYPGFITDNMKKKYHKTPQKYWTALRIAKSKGLLINTDAPIPEIAKAVGYHNIYVYCRAFKQLEGMSPAEFRSNFQEKY